MNADPTGPRGRPRHRVWATRPASRHLAGDQGSVSVWMATGALVMIVLVGLVVDVGGQVRAQQRAHDTAAQAARAGGQQLQAPAAIRGTTTTVDASSAVAAARTYLAGAPDVTGAVVVRGDTVIVDTRTIYVPVFLGIVGISSVDVTGHAESRVTRSVGGVEQ